MNVPPWLLLALVLAFTLALLYQLFRRRFGWRVLGYWFLILLGLLLGEALAESESWNITQLGDLRLLPDMLGAMTGVLVLWLLRA